MHTQIHKGRHTGRHKAAMLAGAAPLLLLGMPAQAQDMAQNTEQAGSAPDSRAQDNSNLHDIIVTANRQAQNIQKVSSAVSVIDGATLRDQGLTNVSQILSDTPNVQIVAQATGYAIDIRGQAYDGSAGRQQPTALEFDGIYNVSGISSVVGFFDVNRVEVLPGPQSTRYGPNALSGIVNVISKDPVLGSWQGNGALTVGNYGMVRGEIGQNIPLTSTLAMRVSGAAIHRNSYFTPAQSNAIAQSGRVKLLFQPGDSFFVKAEYQLDHLGGTGTGDESGASVYSARVASYAGDSINTYANPWASPLVDTAANSDASPDKNHANLYQQTFVGTASYRFADWGAVDATQSYIRQTGTQYSCYGPGSNPIGGTRACSLNHPNAPFYQYSSELRLHNAPGNHILWNLGYYHWNYLRFVYPGAYPAVGTTAAAANGPSRGSLSATATNAIFADVTVPITSRLRAIGGLRESFDKITRQTAGTPIYSVNFSNFDYRAGEEFDVTPHVMQYFTISTGYSPGGASYSSTTGQAVPYANQKLRAMELGIKSRLLGNKLQINADIFQYRVLNFPFVNSYGGFTLPNGTYCPTPTPGQPTAVACQIPAFTANARTRGAEAQIRYNPTRNDSFGTSLAWLDERYDSKQGSCNTLGLAELGLSASDGNCYSLFNDNTTTTQALSYYKVNGLVFPHAPKFSATFSYAHTFRFRSGAFLRVGGEGTHTSSSFVHPDQGATQLSSYAYAFQPAYWQENFNMTFNPASDRWSLNLYMRNASNYAVKQSYQPATLIGDPRTYGITLNAKW